MRTMQFSGAASWTISSAPFGVLKGKAMESGTNAGHATERNRKPMEEFLGSTIPILVHTALLLGLEEDNLRPRRWLRPSPPSAATPS